MRGKREGGGLIGRTGLECDERRINRGTMARPLSDADGGSRVCTYAKVWPIVEISDALDLNPESSRV